MAKTITQSLQFSAKPKALYKLYMDPGIHSELAEAKVAVSGEPGSRFSVGRDLKGKMLHVQPGKVIVQTWRYSAWEKSVPDTVLSFFFEENGEGTKLTMIHANVPDDTADEIRGGWNQFYWKPWRRYLKS